jgi:hypothetical protein
MPENKSRRILQSPGASSTGRDVSMEARSLGARSLRASESRVTMRRRLASMRVGSQRRRYQRLATEDRRLLALSGSNSELSSVGGQFEKQRMTVEVSP